MTEETLGSKLLALKDRSGLSLSQIAKAAKYRNASSIQRYFSADYEAAYLPSSLATRLQDALEGYGDPKIEFEDIHRLTEYGFMLDREVPRRASGITPEMFHMSESRSIRCNATYLANATIDNAELFWVSDDPRMYLLKPAHLFHRSIEAIYLCTTSAMPRYNPGEIVFFETYRPAKIGDDVIVTLNDSDKNSARLIGRLAAKTRETIDLQTYDPPSQITLLTTEIEQIDPVLTASDLLAPISKSDAYAPS